MGFNSTFKGLKTANHPTTFVFTHRALTVCYTYRLVYLYKHFLWLALLKRNISCTETTLCNWESEIFLVFCLDF